MPQTLQESSPNTLKGSFTPDLIASKIWLLTQLAKVQKDLGTVYVLGSWYSNLSILLHTQHVLAYTHIVNVDINPTKLAMGVRLARRFGLNKHVSHLHMDANHLQYLLLDHHPGCVINTSTGEMPQGDWWHHIPQGTLVALQARNHPPGCRDLAQMRQQFALSKVFYQGEKHLHDPQTSYSRFMLIGLK